MGCRRLIVRSRGGGDSPFEPSREGLTEPHPHACDFRRSAVADVTASPEPGTPRRALSSPHASLNAQERRSRLLMDECGPYCGHARPMVKATMNPRTAISPAYKCARSNASGIMVSAIITKIAPAATAVMTATVTGEADSRDKAPRSPARPLAMAMPHQIAKTYLAVRPLLFMPAALESPSGRLEMKIAARTGTP